MARPPAATHTRVQDMDLSLRCYLKGWQGVYLPHVDNPNEVPSTLSSYKTQQFRSVNHTIRAHSHLACMPACLHAPMYCTAR